MVVQISPLYLIHEKDEGFIHLQNILMVLCM